MTMGNGNSNPYGNPHRKEAGEILTDTERDVILSELCGGMSQLLDKERDSAAQHTIPRTLRLGLSRLAAAMVMAGCSPIQSVPDAVRMMQKPLDEWDVAFSVPEYMADLTLLDGEFLTEDGEALIVGNSDIAAELTQGIMRRVIDRCMATGNQDDYVAFRRFIIEHPVATRLELIAVLNSINDEYLRELLRHEAFETVPGDLESNGEVPTCDRCGWTLVKESYGGSLHCADARCRRLEGKVSTRYRKHLSMGDGLRRVLAGLARYTAQPGRLELGLYESLLELDGLIVELWPGFDSYDIGVTFPSGEVWAVDCKDSSRPVWLASTLTNDSIPRQPIWQRAYYVFPDYRRRLDPNYERAFRSRWKSGHDGVWANFEGQFLKAVERRLETG